MTGILLATLAKPVAAPSNLDLSYIWATLSNFNTHTIESGGDVVAGDLAVLHCCAQGSGSYAGAIPSGWTQVRYSRTTSGTGAVWGVIAYKVLGSGDIGATLTGLPAGGGNEGSTILYFRPSKPITSVALYTGSSSGGDEATTGTPVNQTISTAAANDPAYIAIAGYVANGTITTRGSSVTMSEVTGRASPYSYTKYKIYNIGATLEAVTISMADYGNNCLQSCLLQVK